MDRIVSFLCDEEGLATVEYAVAGGLVSAALAISFSDLGEQVGIRIDAITAVITP